jgi:potassium efflux system protein
MGGRILVFTLFAFAGNLVVGQSAPEQPKKESAQPGTVTASPSKKQSSGDNESEVETTTPSPASEGPATDQSAPQEPQAPSSPPGAPTLDSINRRIEQIKAIELDEETKSRIVGIYQEAIQQIQAGRKFAEAAVDFDREREQGPDILKSIQEELSKPIEDPVIRPEVGETLADLDNKLKTREAELDTARKTKADWEAEKARRQTRRNDIPKQLAEAQKTLSALTDVAPGPPQGNGANPLDQAKTTLDQAKRFALQSEIDMLERETRSYEARNDLLKARQDKATRQVLDLEKRVKAWQAVVTSRREADAQAAMQEARLGLLEAHPALKELAEENAELARQRKDLSERIASAVSDDQAIKQSESQLSEEFKNIGDRVKAAGLTEVVGLRLRNRKATLPSIRAHQRALQEIRDRASVMQVEQLEAEDHRSDLVDLEAAVKETLAGVDKNLASSGKKQVEENARDLLKAQLDHLDVLVADYETYFNKLSDLETSQRTYLTSIDDFTNFINKHVLWIQSAERFSLKEFSKTGAALKWLISPENWRAATSSVVGTIRTRPAFFGAFVILLVALVVLRRRINDRIVDIGALVSKVPTDKINLTVRATLLTGLTASIAPGVLFLPAWLLIAPPESSEFSRAVGTGLYETATLLLLAQFIRHMCRTNGLSEKHFKWRKEANRIIRGNMLSIQAIVIPAILIFFIFNAQSFAPYQESLGRIAFCFAFGGTGLIVHRLLRPASGVLDQVFKSRQSGGWLFQIQRLSAIVAGLAPWALVVLALIGYFYTSTQLAALLIHTAAVLFALSFINAFVQRWLLFQMQRRAVREAAEKKSGTSPSDTAVATGEDGTTVKISGPKVQISDINAQTKRLLRAGMTIAVVLGVWTIWSDVIPALNVLNEIQLWDNVVKSVVTTPLEGGEATSKNVIDVVPVTLVDLIFCVLTFALTWIAAQNLPGLLEITILDRLPLLPSARYAVATVTRYLITTVGIILAFGMIGIGWSQVQWLVAAMTVGLGFGLQEIFANFVSGLILLFEQPIRVGDIVTVGNTSGVVSRIRIRATTILDWEQKELIVPNKRFITGEVLNWTLSDSIIRLSFPLEVARGPEPGVVRTMLEQIPVDVPTVLSEPESFVVFLGFGNNSLKFELREYTRRDDILTTLNDTNSLIDRRMREKGIEISIPRQETILRSATPAGYPLTESQSTKEPEEATIS